MTYCKPVVSPFLSGVRIEDGYATPLVDCTKYQQLIESLLYLTHAHIDISYTIGVVSRYMQDPHELHWKDVKKILQLVKKTNIFGIHYASRCILDLYGYTDSNWVHDATYCKYTLGYFLNIGSSLIFWSNKK
jgi:hypothetical protein